VFGFAPLEYTFRTSQSAAEQKMSTAIMERRNKLNQRYWRALRKRDLSAAKDVLEDMKEFNKRHPYAVIDGAAIKRSVKSSLENTKTMHNGVSVNPMMEDVLKMSREEYKQWD
jgi:hypothetical protein